MNLRFILSALLLLGGLSQETCGQDEVVSMIQLIANPEKYDGQKVAVVGFVKLAFEERHLPPPERF
jgi:hypothetical protein